jgi:light-regulated signal transduction histidine kinase (bacteriophytochrome)
VAERTAQLEEKNIELEKMNAELQSFAYVASHDLQEPLRKIQTFITLVSDKEQQTLNENVKSYFERIQSAASRMQTLIHDLLLYSRTNSAERVFERTGLPIILEQVKKELHEDIQQKNAVIEDTGLRKTNIIPFQFRQLLHNVIGNSLKFSREGLAPHIQLRDEFINGENVKGVTLQAGKKYYHLTIADNGIGFEEEFSERIFQVFQRLHGRDEYKGTGIGLAIVKKIVENHQGKIIAHGVPGKGATFQIYIPADL